MHMSTLQLKRNILCRLDAAISFRNFLNQQQFACATL
jgi:hypothetical protein